MLRLIIDQNVFSYEHVSLILKRVIMVEQRMVAKYFEKESGHLLV